MERDGRHAPARGHQEAMGANMVNTMCEGVAGLVEKLLAARSF